MLRSVKDLQDYGLGALDGQIGRVRDFYFDDHHWAIRYAVADTGKWIPRRQVLISPYAITDIDEDDHVLDVELTKKQIEESPLIATRKPISRQFEMEYYRYYGWPMYWYGAEMWGSSLYPVYHPHPGPIDVKTPGHENSLDKYKDSALRSAQETFGFRLEAKDGDVGEVDDFVFDDETWAIRYVVINTHYWWTEKQILLVPQWVERVSWRRSVMRVNLSMDFLKHAPKYLGASAISPEYEHNVLDYYEKPAHWKHSGEVVGS
jgi:hypothetical protein